MRGTKPEIRQQMRRARRRLSLADQDAAARSLASWLPTFVPYQEASAVLAYVATENEFPTAALIDDAWRRGKKVFLPRVVGDELRFALHSREAALHPGRFGILSPAASAMTVASYGEPTVAFLPLVGWDDTGNRLGRGGGFYDRAFSMMRPDHVIGLGYAFQRQAALPCDPWDVRLDCVVTERGVLYFGSGENPSLVRKEDATFNDIRVDRIDRNRPGRGPRRRPGLSSATAD